MRVCRARVLVQHFPHPSLPLLECPSPVSFFQVILEFAFSPKRSFAP